MKSNLNKRYYGMDFLRMALMLSGIIFHAGLFYTCAKLEGIWPIKEVDCHLGYDILCGWLHLFRIPAFFVIAGFFAALLTTKYGVAKMSINRIRRIALPFIVSWLILYPIVLMSVWLLNHLGEDQVLQNSLVGLFSKELFDYRPRYTLHLWFLYYLVIFYIILIILRKLLNRLTTFPFWILFGSTIVISGLGFYFSSLNEFDGPYSFIPDLYSLLGFAPFFLFGYLLYANQKWISLFSRWHVQFLVTSLLPLGFYLLIRKEWIELGEITAKISRIVLSLSFSWLMILGLIGWVSRKFIHPNRLIRYLSDASYWVYLIHLPLILLVGGLLNQIIHHSLLVWLMNIILTTTITLLSYHYLVRSTLIGKWLNGRKYH